ncbi:MAG: SIS domain-containing protein [Actinomycetota bacterium]
MSLVSQLPNDVRSAVSQHLQEHLAVVSKLDAQLGDQIVDVARLIAKALARGNILYWCGNGGSASDSQHLAAEFIGRFRNNRRPLASVALTTDTSVITCVANDFGYDQIFVRQVEALCRKGDVLVAISTSGNSRNVVEAVKSATQLGVTTVGLLSATGGALRELVTYPLLVPSTSTARIQESHILIGHMLCDLVERELGIA